jgi:3-methyl-2-oxobutanoate hydroxymethyltransferase
MDMEEKLTIPKIRKNKTAGKRITSVTCYDFSFAKLVDRAGVEIVLVGDSLGMVIQGHRNTLPVSMDEMIYHSRCVSRGLKRALLVTDMPFMSYQSSTGEALQSAGRVMKGGRAESVKMEGGVEIAELVYRMNRIGIPVMGHIGLKPQQIHKYGGYKIQGKTISEERSLMEDSHALEEAGCWALVLEGIPQEVAERITGRLKIPTIGIASGPACDGQVLVLYDLLGIDPEFHPRFVKRYADLGTVVHDAVQQYRLEVKEGVFPGEEHSFRRNLINAADKFRKPNALRRA